MNKGSGVSRRNVLLTGGAAMAALSLPRAAFARKFPSQNIMITIPTGEGGGADRDARLFTASWRKRLDTNFEFEFYPGAAGQVGYQFYLRKKADPHSLLFANLGPEVIMLTLQAPDIKVGRDVVYIQQTLSEPMAVWVGPNSPIKSLEQLVGEAKKRTVTVSVSRLPHPASIGMLALGESMNAKFNLVPYGGGNPSAMAAITGEVDCCALPITNSIQLADQARILGVFADKNVVGEPADNAPTVNEVFGTKLPPLTSSRAFAVHAATLEKFPDEIAQLKSSMQQTLEDPAYSKSVESAGLPSIFIDPGDQEQAMSVAQATAELAERYRSLLTGK